MNNPHNGTATSIAAAQSFDSTALRELVFNTIAEAGEHGCTDEEVQQRLGLDGNTQRPRRWELSHKEGRIVPSGKSRPTKSGYLATVWVVGEGTPAPVVRAVTTEEVIAHLREIGATAAGKLYDQVFGDIWMET